jgi:hypothetical protein
LTVGNGLSGGGAVLKAVIKRVGGVARINITQHGSKYAQPPSITIAPPPSGTQATAQIKMAGGSAELLANISGGGGLRMSQAAPFSAGVPGNNLQITTFGDDNNDSISQVFTRPTQAVFYYNIKADPALKARYPSVPVDRSAFMLNGVEMDTSLYQEATGTLKDQDATIGLTRKTLLWSTFDINGSPWDSSYRQLVKDLGTGGRDHILPQSGPVNYEDDWWRFWEHVFKYQQYRNKAVIHINRTSRFYQSGRVASLAVLSPLKLIDLASGVMATQDGAPMTGQLMIALDNQVNLLGGTLEQVDLTKPGEVRAIYQNNTGKQVYVSSVLLHCVFQNISSGTTPQVNNSARVTVGTQEGAYRNWIGTVDPDADTQEGRATQLYLTGQMKELFPDERDAYMLLQPGQTLYLRVDTPAGAPIVTQLVVARVKGHVF